MIPDTVINSFFSHPALNKWMRENKHQTDEWLWNNCPGAGWLLDICLSYEIPVNDIYEAGLAAEGKKGKIGADIFRSKLPYNRFKELIIGKENHYILDSKMNLISGKVPQYGEMTK